MHQFGIIKWCLNTVDARYEHEESYKDNLLVAIQLTQKCTRIFLQCVTKAASPSNSENKLNSNELASVISLISSWTEVSSLDKQEDS